jgi:predicted DNA binding CopG/RHH family protein
MKKAIPTFKNIEEEAKFWGHEDSTKYIDWNKSVLARFPNLKPSSETISLRLPASLLSEIKILAHKEDVPYQSLIKIVLAREVSFLRRQTIKRIIAS